MVWREVLSPSERREMDSMSRLVQKVFGSRPDHSTQGLTRNTQGGVQDRKRRRKRRKEEEEEETKKIFLKNKKNNDKNKRKAEGGRGDCAAIVVSHESREIPFYHSILC